MPKTKGEFGDEIMNRINKTTAIQRTLYYQFFNKKEISQDTKVEVYEGVLASMLIYVSGF